MAKLQTISFKCNFRQWKLLRFNHFSHWCNFLPWGVIDEKLSSGLDNGLGRINAGTRRNNNVIITYYCVRWAEPKLIQCSTVTHTLGRHELCHCFWCAILIAHQLLWQNMEVPVSIFQESPLAGEPRERLFQIHSVHRYQLCAKYLYPSTLLWQINCCNL